MLINVKMPTILSNVVFIMLMNVKIPIIVGILTYMSMINFVLSQAEHEKSLKPLCQISRFCSDTSMGKS